MNNLPRTFCNLISATCLTTLGVGLAACGDDAEAVETRRELEEAADSTGDYARKAWNDFVTDHDEELQAMRARFDELKDEASDATGEAKQVWERQSAELQEELKALGQRLSEARDQSAESAEKWGEQLDAGFEEAKQRLSTAAEALEGK